MTSFTPTWPRPYATACGPTEPRPLPRRSLGVCLAILASAGNAAARPGAPAVATAHPLATAAGIDILRAGGNAFDAAVAVTAALGVVEPYASGLGGGGFWLLYRARGARSVVLDGRETAPGAASPALYRAAPPRSSIDGPLAAAIPGVPAAIDHLAGRYGRWPLRRSLAPAIRLASEGFPVTPRYREHARERLAILGRSKAAASVFLKDGQPPPLGHRILQPELARLLESIAERGAAVFYRGEVAERLVRGVRAAGGIWSLADLAGYRTIEREPLRGTYRGLRILTVPPPSAGGVILIEALNILEGMDLAAFDRAARAHLIIEAWRRAYRDRGRYLGDPAYATMPLMRLLSKDYARALRAGIRLDHAGAREGSRAPSRDLNPGNTTHFSIIDCEGNRVAATLSINYSFGSGFMVEGVLLNGEMDDFSIAPGLPNVYGLRGGEANAIGPRKRPLSSMAPTFLEEGDRVALVGTPGGSRIPSMVLLSALEFAAGRGPSRWLSRPRFHHQYLPDVVQLEPYALSPAEQAGLRRRGHRIKSLAEPYGNMQAILLDRRTGTAVAASDPRGEGSARVLPISQCLAQPWSGPQPFQVPAELVISVP